MGSVPQLETVLIEMIVEAADFPVASFDSVAGEDEGVVVGEDTLSYSCSVQSAWGIGADRRDKSR
jgi:hypothetical protein